MSAGRRDLLRLTLRRRRSAYGWSVDVDNQCRRRHRRVVLAVAAEQVHVDALRAAGVVPQAPRARNRGEGGRCVPDKDGHSAPASSWVARATRRRRSLVVRRNGAGSTKIDRLQEARRHRFLNGERRSVRLPDARCLPPRPASRTRRDVGTANEAPQACLLPGSKMDGIRSTPVKIGR